jgi:hypothetical protein
MLNFLLASVLVALIVSFMIIVSEKTGILVYLASKTRDRTLNMLLSCYFCIGFWLSLLMSIFISMVTGNVSDLFICVTSSVLIRKLV